MLLTNCPFCILSFEKGLEFMQESGEPMEFGIFDFSRCSQGLLVRKRRIGQWGVRMEGGGCRDDHVFEKQVYTQLTHISLTINPHAASKWQRKKLPTCC